MANKITSPVPSVGGTLAGGIQDVSAILPLIGTDQCEKHVGSALKGGYLYAAAAPLSIFGSLGTVKAGISILIASISISVPRISVSFSNTKPSFKCHRKKKWLGGKMLKDAGFELAGTVASLIGMDGDRFKAESRLIRILEEKHIDDPEKISISWKSRQWNIMLVLFSILGAAISIMPYVGLILGPTSWRPKHVHLPWLYPILRIVGSCGATITSQFLIQSRVVSVMKNRIVFMIMQQRFEKEYKEQFDVWRKDSKFQWDPSLPAEQCIWSLEQYPLSSLVEFTENPADKKKTNTSMDTPSKLDGDSQDTAHRSIAMTVARSPLSDLRRLQKEYFPSPIQDAAFSLIFWIILGLSLPATVAGYIGCFTLVGATPSTGNGPLVWVGLEAALSVLRVFIWASNPNFDEQTEVKVELKLSKHQPMVTTNDHYPDFGYYIDTTKPKAFTLMPDDEFLAWITPFTGPLDQFQKSHNIPLYFTLATEYHTESPSNISEGHLRMRLYMTIFDVNRQIGVTSVSSGTSFDYYNVSVKYNTLSQALEAIVQSDKTVTRPWRMEYNNLFSSLEKYYHYIVGAISQRDINTLTAILPWKWDLSPQFESGLTNPSEMDMALPLPHVSTENELYGVQGYEQYLKSDLVAGWGQWIMTDMMYIRMNAQLYCDEASRSKTEKWKLTELDVQLVWGWALRELKVLTLSLELENILRAKMEACISEITRIQGNVRLEVWMRSQFNAEQLRRLEIEREAAKTRMENAMKKASEQADIEGRSFENDLLWSPNWNGLIEDIDKKWLEGIRNAGFGHGFIQRRLSWLNNQLAIHTENRTEWHDDERFSFVEQLHKFPSHKHWCSQHDIEVEAMESTIKCVRLLPRNSTMLERRMTYDFPGWDFLAIQKFVNLQSLKLSTIKMCSALVYDAFGCDKEAVYNVIARNTTRSVIHVDSGIVASIPPNEHLLFLSCKDRQGVEPPFVNQNRERWWSQQTTNSSTFYFTPGLIKFVRDAKSLNLCGCNATQTIAHILIFLTVPSIVRVSILHHGTYEATKVLLQESGEELVCISTIPTAYFQLRQFQVFVLQPGAHDLELVPQVPNIHHAYYLHDIFVELSDKPIDDSRSTDTGVVPATEDVAPESLVKEDTSTPISATGDFNQSESS